MRECIIINTGPLIAFARMEALELPGRLPFSFICPREVREELDEGHRAGYPKISPAWLSVESLRLPLSPLSLSALDKGEAAVIQLACERNVIWVCIDEWKGRRAALAAGLKVTGVLGLLGRAKSEGIITALHPFVQRALAAGVRYDEQLVKTILKAAGE